MGVVLGLYGLNCASTIRRSTQIERQAIQLRSLKLSGNPWHVAPDALTQVEAAATNPWQWRLRLEHLARALPPSARLVAVGFNAQGQIGTPDAATFVIDGEIRTARGESPVPAVMAIVAALQRDREFAAGFGAIRLRATQAQVAPGAAAFTIECH